MEREAKMNKVKQTILKFVLRSTANPRELMARFYPQGKTVLNRTAWLGKEPRSCGITNMKSRSYSADDKSPIIWDLEVSYRPKGIITYVGHTKYDGWTAMVLDRKKDGTLLDGKGQPLLEGQQPVYLPFELYEDVEFNDIDFGDFVNESEVERVKHATYDNVLQSILESRKFNASIRSSFVAARRQRPLVKIVLSNAPSGTGSDGFGTKIINVNNMTPQLQQVLLDHLTELLNGFVEGRYSLGNVGNNDMVFVELTGVLVDCTPNEEGKDSRFNILHEYMPQDFLEELAIQLMATYEVDVSVVDGPKTGLLLQRVSQQQ